MQTEKGGNFDPRLCYICGLLLTTYRTADKLPVCLECQKRHLTEKPKAKRTPAIKKKAVKKSEAAQQELESDFGESLTPPMFETLPFYED